MARRATFVLAALAVALVLIGSAPVAAQTDTGNRTERIETERIDTNTVLMSSSYDEGSGIASVTIRSDTLQEITVTDAGSFMQGGKVPTRTVMVKPDETVTIEIPATEVRGWVGVSISTPRTLYSEPINEMDTNTLSFVNRLTSPEALTTGAVSMALWMMIAGLYVLWIEGGEPEVAG